MRPNVICISRDAAFRQDFVGLEADHTIVYSNDTEDTLRLVQDHRHQVAFVSLIHPLPATESLIRQLKSISPLTQVILCAKGYVADPVSVPEVVNCIKA
ncbi:hypothetical protein EBR96_10200, partial [bacterium]|nr:hypothetical protein [bacterium]